MMMKKPPAILFIGMLFVAIAPLVVISGDAVVLGKEDHHAESFEPAKPQQHLLLRGGSMSSSADGDAGRNHHLDDVVDALEEDEAGGVLVTEEDRRDTTSRDVLVDVVDQHQNKKGKNNEDEAEPSVMLIRELQQQVGSLCDDASQECGNGLFCSVDYDDWDDYATNPNPNKTKCTQGIHGDSCAAGVSSGAYTNGSCALYHHCWKDTRYWFQGADKLYCQNGKLSSFCEMDSECDAGLFCNLVDDGSSRKKCSQGIHGDYCAAGHYLAYTYGSCALHHHCYKDTRYNPEYFYCQNGNLTSFCEMDSECDAGLFCRLDYGGSSRKKCTQGFEGDSCAAAPTGNYNAWTKGSCAPDHHCVFPGNDIRRYLCYDGSLGKFCDDSSDCKSGLFCLQDRTDEYWREKCQARNELIIGPAWKLAEMDDNHLSISFNGGSEPIIFFSSGSPPSSKVPGFNAWSHNSTFGEGPIFGDRAVEIGNWRISARYHEAHLTVGHRNGNVARIYRSDRTIHGNVTAWNDWKNFPDIGEPQCAFLSSKGFLQIGHWRIADLVVPPGSTLFPLVVGHSNGNISSYYRSDGTTFDKESTLKILSWYNSPWLAKWNLEEGGTVVAGSDSGCPPA